MRNILIAFIFSFFSVILPAQEKIEHHCVPVNEYSYILKVQIVHSPSEPYGKDFLEIYGLFGSLVEKWEVQYGNNMTYIAYFNEAENIYFEREWPVENDRGAGRLQLQFQRGPNYKPKTYLLDCSSPKSTGD